MSGASSLDKLIGKNVSHIWFGDYSALYVEFGSLSKELNKSGALKNNPEGEITIFAGWNWRVNNKKSILLGSSETKKFLIKEMRKLLDVSVTSVELYGYIPELHISFSNGLSLSTFSLSNGQPDWTVSFNKDEGFHIYIKNGAVCCQSKSL